MPNRPGSAPGLASGVLFPVPQTPGPAQARFPEGHRAPSSIPSLGQPALPAPGLKLGSWSLPLAWTTHVPRPQQKTKLPRAVEASCCLEKAGL